MQLSSTATQRTYRYVRISIVGAVAALGVALVVVTAAHGPVTSLSALFYTPARTVFTGVLFAVALAFLALSGHSVEQVLLNLAALFAPAIAIVPTPVAPGDGPGIQPICPDGVPCVPAGYVPDVRTDIVTLAVTAMLGAAVAVVLAHLQRTLTPGVVVAVAAAVVLAAVALVWALAADASLLRIGHLIATGGFFGLMVAVAVVSAVTSRIAWRRLYAGVAIGMGAFLVYLGTVTIARLAGIDQTGQPWILVGEAGLVLLFAAFWTAQTVQRWADVDPAVRVR